MNRERLAVMASLSLGLTLGVIGMKQGQAQATKKAYPSMAPLDQYLMADRKCRNWPGAKRSAGCHIGRLQKFWRSGGTATNQPSRARTGLCVLWSEGGYRPPTLRSFGTPKFGAPSFSIRQPRDPFCRSLTREQKWC